MRPFTVLARRSTPGRVAALLLLSLFTTASARPADQTPRARRDGKGIDQVWVPAGSFRMGTTGAQADAIVRQHPPAWVVSELPSEQPQHAVRLTAGYWIDAYEVTNAAFAAFVDAGGYGERRWWSDAGWAWGSAHAGRRACADASSRAAPKLPCVNVTWFEAEAYAAWRGGRLPTEAQWEFAARGPDSLVYPWGNQFDAARANVVGSTALKPVGSYPSGRSRFGAHDMAGNAMEWVADWLDVQYDAHAARDNPAGPTTGRVKIEKGGWWGSNEFVARSAYRHFEDTPDYADHHIGFRIVTPGR